MRKNLLLMLLAAAGANAADQVIILDLTKATTPLQFNAENGSWVGTYDDDEESIESQCFSFVHSSMGDYKSWWGFTASNCANNSQSDNFVEFQWANMAAGGIELDDNGSVKLNEYGAPVVNATVPYLVAYYGSFFGKRPTDMVFNDGKNYDPQGVYVNLTSYPYYCLEYGLAPARPFTNGDEFHLTIHGVAPDETEKEVTVSLCTYANGDLTINRGWKYVDLTSLGTVNELYFTMDGTDTGLYGLNTPSFFALDKLSVKPAEENGIANPAAQKIALSYNRETKTVSWSGIDFADIQNVAGQTVMAGTDGELNLSSLPAGVYVVRAGARILKIAK